MADTLQNSLEISYRGPWKGVNTELPEDSIELNESPSITNFIAKSGELRSRPRFICELPFTPDGLKVREITSFIDSNSVVHTVCLTQYGMYQLSSNWQNLVASVPPKNPWQLVGSHGGAATAGNPIVVPDNPFANQIFLNKLYFTNGCNQLLYWDGIANSVQVATNLFGAFFLMELDAHLVLGNTVEGSTFTNFAQRIRWSVSGNPTQWDSNSFVGAGLNDMLDTPDSITGLIAIGRYGYIFRTNGVTQMVPVGKGTLPFDFNHLWAADRGIGNVFSQAIATYGSLCIFISSEDIYKLTETSLDSIGGNAFNSIFNDLQTAVDKVQATIIPYWAPNYIYHHYLLMIPTITGCTYWLYDIKRDHWVTWKSVNKFPTTPPKYVFVA